MSTANELHLYVNIPGHTPNYPGIAAALESIPYETPEKEFPAPAVDIPPVTIHIGKGVYREKLTVSRPNVTFLGEASDRGDVVIVYGDYAQEIMPDGLKRGTFRTATVRIDAQDFKAAHLTFQNDSGFGYQVGQALALYTDGDRCYFEDCALLGGQDTLFTAPLPEKEFEKGGFRGPGEFRPRTMTRQMFRNCLIQGDVDFIFGSAIVYFENCEIYSRLQEGKPFPEGSEKIYGYVAAPSTPESEKYGYVFKDCRLTGNCPPHSIYLGRPWREYAKTVFINCELGEHIHPEGWKDWNKPHDHFHFAEYHSYGPGANPDARADFSHQMSEAEAAEYTTENVLKGWKPGL